MTNAVACDLTNAIAPWIDRRHKAYAAVPLVA